MHNNNNSDTILDQPRSICEIQKDEEEPRFRFTPTKVVPKIPHLWDRKPTTPYKTRPKSRKLWKRFRLSFNNMKRFDCVTGAATDRVVVNDDGGYTHDSLRTEINGSDNWGFLRGVKRLRLGNENQIGANESAGENFDRGRSFLETKWEEEVIRKRRKLPVSVRHPVVDNLQESGQNCGKQSPVNQTSNATSLDAQIPTARNPEGEDESQTIEVMKPTKEAPVEGVHGDLLRGPSNHIRTTEASGLYADTEDLCRSEITQDESPEIVSGTKESPRLVQSALRSSLDREDTDLLNEFVSKAMAKRAASAALAEERSEEPAEREPSKEGLVSEFPTPPTRRALEDIDVNSPSPLRPRLSPTKAGGHDSGPAGSTNGSSPEPSADEPVESCTDEQQSPPSPVVRRSSRARTPRQPPRITPPVVRGTTISLRRPKGTEFVFQQRTEAQELALVTRRNTKQNKGGAILPGGALKAMAEQQWCPEMETGRKPSARKHASDTQKHVSWNERRLAEYEGEEYSDDNDDSDENKPNGVADDAVDKSNEKESTTKLDRGGTRRANSKRRVKEGSNNDYHDTKTATNIGRRVRRVEKSTTPTGATGPFNTRANTTARRKLLSPKAPSKATATVEFTGQSQYNGSRGTSTGKMSNNSNGSKNMTLTSNAGSTPVPKRFRAR